MRAFITPPPKNKRPDSQDPIIYDNSPQDESQTPGGWNVKSELSPNYDEIVEAWRAQNPKISKVK
jgi:uncharacterized protein